MHLAAVADANQPPQNATNNAVAPPPQNQGNRPPQRNAPTFEGPPQNVPQYPIMRNGVQQRNP